MEMITKAALAKRWDVSATTIMKHTEDHSIRVNSVGKIELDEVKSQEGWILTGLYANYNSFVKYMGDHHNVDPSTLQSHFHINMLPKTWMAGDFFIAKEVAMEMIDYYIGNENKCVYNHMLAITLGI